MQEDLQPQSTATGFITMPGDPQDDVGPDNSISNVPSTTSAHSSQKSLVSCTSSVHIKAEVDLAALMARQKLMQDKHALEEEEEQIRKRKERLKLDNEIAAHMTKVSVLRSASLTGAKSTTTKQSNAMNSYLHKAQGKPMKFNADVAPFIPWTMEPPKRDARVINRSGDLATRPKVRTATYAHVQLPALEHHTHKSNPHAHVHLRSGITQH